MLIGMEMIEAHHAECGHVLDERLWDLARGAGRGVEGVDVADPD